MKIINGKILNENGVFELGELNFTDKISSDDRNGSRDCEIIDARGCYVTPGYVDVHTHGRGGTDFMSCDDKGFAEAARLCAAHGVTSVFPTVMTNPYENVIGAIKRIARFAPECEISFDGIHIEGPYISEKRPGCHVTENIRGFDIAEADELIRAACGLRVHFTVAPEKAGGREFIEFCVKNGASVGIGHSDADFELCKRAVEWGCVSFTHTFNAMRPLSHREPGCVGASLLTDAYSEFICDMFHVCPEVVKMGYALKKRGSFVIVTDSLPPADLPDGRYMFAGMPINVTGNVILTDGGTIAGSGTNMHDSVLKLMRCCDIPFGEAVCAATAAPARMTGIYDACGSLTPGKRADIVITDEKTFEIKRVIAKGRTVFAV